jgi:hypothetical protein
VSGHGGYTYGDFPLIGGAPEPHASGEVWSQTLWDLRGALGHRVADMDITRGMSLSPNYPSMLDMRNAIIQADRASYGGKHVKRIWSVFAHRGMGFFAGTTSSVDVSPVEDFRTPPGAKAPRGTLRGRVIDRVTNRPLKNALVIVQNHRLGLAARYVDRTDAQGRYNIRRIAVGRYPYVSAAHDGYQVITKGVRVSTGVTKVSFRPRRDWAALNGGASLTGFNGPNYAPQCGPRLAIDARQVTGWGSTAGDNTGAPTNVIIPKHIVVKLPRAVTVTSFNVDPTANCGDSGSASTGDFRIETSANGTVWTAVAHGTFTPADQFRFNLVKASAPTPHVRYVRFTMLGNQTPDFAHNCPDGPYSGCSFMDLTEFEVFGKR